VEYTQERKGFWHEPDGQPTSESNALADWVPRAHLLLTDLAGTYHGVLREHELAEQLQEQSGIHTTRPHAKWMEKVLTPVATLCEHAGEPPLTSLVVTPETDDLPAARLRLECYRWAGSAPADGGEPQPLRVATTRAPRARAGAGSTGGTGSTGTRAPRTPREPKPVAPKRVAKTDRPITVCPTCYMAIPATGVCDNCG